MLVNVASLLLFSTSFVLRTEWASSLVPPGSGVPPALSIVAAVVLGAGGWLGGRLVHVHGVGVTPAVRARSEERTRRRAA
jgi:uncharacterized membrane protein